MSTPTPPYAANPRRIPSFSSCTRHVEASRPQKSASIPHRVVLASSPEHARLCSQARALEVNAQTLRPLYLPSYLTSLFSIYPYTCLPLQNIPLPLPSEAQHTHASPARPYSLSRLPVFSRHSLGAPLLPINSQPALALSTKPKLSPSSLLSKSHYCKSLSTKPPPDPRPSPLSPDELPLPFPQLLPFPLTYASTTSPRSPPSPAAARASSSSELLLPVCSKRKRPKWALALGPLRVQPG